MHAVGYRLSWKASHTLNSKRWAQRAARASEHGAYAQGHARQPPQGLTAQPPLTCTCTRRIQSR